MPNSHKLLNDPFVNKPECVIDLPPGLLSQQKMEECRTISGLAIVEMAGRDSVAAAVKSVEDKDFTDLLPTYVYTGTEHGPWSSVTAAVERMKKRLPAINIQDLLVIGSPGFWQALNGRFISELINRYGFYTPCIGCHLYLHSIRIPLAVALGNVPIIAGERERHNGNAKINQAAKALDGYQDLAEHFGVSLLLPLRHIAEGNRIEKILGFHWQEGQEQLGCVLSGNYKCLNSDRNIKVDQIVRYLHEFALPFTRQIITSYIEGHVPNHHEIAAELLAS
ncbi:hypothetical protein ACFL9T_06575 [Thermodesulfobacteriota bacterium]